ncbi:MAG: adenylate/guanylate cyclase domain-containing protein [Anaerolineales bacterium]|jgi:adenylate cyclase
MTEQSEHDAMVEATWRRFLLKGDIANERRQQRLFKILPAQRRCKFCKAPLVGAGAPVARVFFDKRPSNLNPRFCTVCENFALEHQGGAEIPIAMLFADVRGSTTLAEKLSASEFSRLINRFYRSATGILIQSDALIDKLIGDEVVGIYVPGFAGDDYVHRSVEAAQDLLRLTGHGDQVDPWIPVGAGIHTGEAFVGAVGAKDGVIDITALGDVPNTASRLASQAAAGEIILSESTAKAAGINTSNLEMRQLELKGKRQPMNVWVMRLSTI